MIFEVVRWGSGLSKSISGFGGQMKRESMQIRIRNISWNKMEIDIK
jgi:hypothetical protein